MLCVQVLLYRFIYAVCITYTHYLHCIEYTLIYMKYMEYMEYMESKAIVDDFSLSRSRLYGFITLYQSSILSLYTIRDQYTQSLNS